MSRSRLPVNARQPGWVALLVRVLCNAPELPGALCVGRPALFDAHDGPDGPLTAQAIALCRRCPSLGACGAWVDTVPAYRRPRGVVAGAYRGRAL